MTSTSALIYLHLLSCNLLWVIGLRCQFNVNDAWFEHQVRNILNLDINAIIGVNWRFIHKISRKTEAILIELNFVEVTRQLEIAVAFGNSIDQTSKLLLNLRVEISLATLSWLANVSILVLEVCFWASDLSFIGHKRDWLSVWFHFTLFSIKYAQYCQTFSEQSLHKRPARRLGPLRDDLTIWRNRFDHSSLLR